ncbi:MAG: PadR family transcriptional regulator [Bacillota bacterium]|nr:PadR family transcriptional regulator [Bacillota bacterium]
MVRALILFFLNVKPTHGYDIQRFIELNGADKWGKIQSGSIYYALNKLEKEGFIETLKEERNGARVRKIYTINDRGREELRRLLKEELSKPLIEVESEKFMLHTMINKLSREEVISKVQEQLQFLREKKAWWESGKKLKMGDRSLKVDVLNFDMVISNLDYQIKWNEALIEEIDAVISFSDSAERLIRNIDFSDLEEQQFKDSFKVQNEVDVLKYDIMKNPENLQEKIERLIDLLKK